MGEQDRQRGQGLRQGRVLVVEGEVVMQDPGQARRTRISSGTKRRLREPKGSARRPLSAWTATMG
jgi:hypothetical protein